MSKFTNLLNTLDGNTMYRLSLSSKELFHSNFLEFLWREDKIKFLQMLEDMSYNSGTIQSGYDDYKEIMMKRLIKSMIAELRKNDDKYQMGREVENFDICIYHEGKRKEKIYDIIIENKVKSIPYKEQLDKYKKKCDEKKQNPIYILLSLTTNFPNKEEIKDSGWNIIDYKDLASEIDTLYGTQNIYITDYIEFVKTLVSIKNQIFVNFKDSTYFDNNIVEECRNYRLHDLYLKLRGSYFIGLLKDSLDKQNIKGWRVDFRPSKDELDKKSPHSNTIYLHSDMNNGKSTITISILLDKVTYEKGKVKNGNVFEIQIEGDQYRHILVRNGLLVIKNVDSLIYSANIKFFDVKTLPFTPPISWHQKNGFNRYQPDALYKYVKYNIDKTNVTQMIGLIVDDVKKILSGIDRYNTAINNILL